jgi:hypothetical protein
MVDDIVFYGNCFFVELPLYGSGTITRIEAQTAYYEIRIPNKESASIF